MAHGLVQRPENHKAVRLDAIDQHIGKTAHDQLAGAGPLSRAIHQGGFPDSVRRRPDRSQRLNRNQRRGFFGVEPGDSLAVGLRPPGPLKRFLCHAFVEALP